MQSVIPEDFGVTVASPGLKKTGRRNPFPGLSPWATDGRPFGAANFTTLQSIMSL
jgi:hypothetical protein